MKIQAHRLVQDDGRAIDTLASPHAGGTIRPRFLVVHYTGGSSAAGSIAWFRDPASKVSAHLVIARDGGITQMVPFHREAWHAGASRWGPLTGLNKHSIGIELDNAGYLVKSGGKWVSPLTRRSYPESDVTVAVHKNDPPGSAPSGWHAYSAAQIEAVLACGVALFAHYELADVLGHDDIAPGRKRDPGPDFPMESVRARLLGRADNRPERCRTTARLYVRDGPGPGFAALPGTPLPLGTEVEVLTKQGAWWQVDVVGEVNGVMDLVGWSHSKYLEQIDV
ncbi:MAG: N-acetylmuramyl-L-alanine amidase [Hydrogenophilales bacterium 16-64-46]|nr:MAG: N-acetylmuramyl-L-alanine amidase [Hydrogenophilales bacterium 12-64-13]OYZ04968.1 MAG: N-acetylmuramyl-L-alanine amidase [Hydrogenophilales bacterium 16-64-46]OZA37612.1 MAG: N-acetylmuramyl-L-alanine amidase [Hydrogenophilales bacterium 17-64-34]HQT00882.1 N-acetylmuramoyl-L-alanine amidase [Thiobacillus sp.]